MKRVMNEKFKGIDRETQIQKTGESRGNARERESRGEIKRNRGEI